MVLRSRRTRRPICAHISLCPGRRPVAVTLRKFRPIWRTPRETTRPERSRWCGYRRAAGNGSADPGPGGATRRPGHQGHQGRRPLRQARRRRGAPSTRRPSSSCSRATARSRTATARRPSRSLPASGRSTACSPATTSSPSWSSSATRRTRGSPTAPAGPQHNKIPAARPRRSTTRTYWTDDFDRAHYLDMFFGSRAASRSRASTRRCRAAATRSSGDVSDWVQVPYNEASYGETESHTDMTRFIDDGAEAWYAAAEGGGQDRRRDQGVPGDVRQVGPLRLRQRRRLQRGRRLHRPLPGHPRR